MRRQYTLCVGPSIWLLQNMYLFVTTPVVGCRVPATRRAIPLCLGVWVCRTAGSPAPGLALNGVSLPDVLNSVTLPKIRKLLPKVRHDPWAWRGSPVAATRMEVGSWKWEVGSRVKVKIKTLRGQTQFYSRPSAQPRSLLLSGHVVLAWTLLLVLASRVIGFGLPQGPIIAASSLGLQLD